MKLRYKKQFLYRGESYVIDALVEFALFHAFLKNSNEFPRLQILENTFPLQWNNVTAAK